MEQNQAYTIVLCHFNECSENILSARMFVIHYELTYAYCQGLFWVKTPLPKADHSSSFSNVCQLFVDFQKVWLVCNSLKI